MSYGFVAYIDESGDDGLERVKPIHPDGSSEWLVLSAVVAQAKNERLIGRVRNDILSKFHNCQRKDIHYRDLSDTRKAIACREIASASLRCFVVMSNKKNIIGYNNPACYPEEKFLYWWLTRLLLERVTPFCARKSLQLYGAPRSIKMIFSLRGGMAYERLVTYLNLLKFQTSTGHVFLNVGNLNWDVVDLEQIFAIAHKNEAGLQLADVVSGAFYEAVSLDGKNPCETSFAELLIPRLYRGPRGGIVEYGVKTMPHPRQMNLTLKQRAIFNRLGYRERW